MTLKPGYFKNSYLCIDQIFIKTDEQFMGHHEAKIVVCAAGKQLEKKIQKLEFNEPKKLDIELFIERLLKESTPVHVDIFLDGHLFTEFDFVFERDTLTSLYHFKDNEKYFVRIIIRAYTDGGLKFQIGTLHEYEMCDFEDENIKFIGEGGFGQVLKAREKFSHKIVALKCLSHYDIRDHKNPAIREFLPFISMPHHPNMVEIYGFMFYKCCLYLVLEYFPIGSLNNFLSFLRHCELPDHDYYFDYFPSFLYGMFHCLHYIHSFGFIHRDISLDNILVSDYFESKLIDFSLARGDDEDELTKYIGRDQYASPEVRSGDKYDKSTDYYSVSVIVSRITISYLKKYNSEEVKHNIFSSLEKVGPMWRKIYTLIYNTFNHVKPEMRLNFAEMCILIELISDDEHTNELIDDLSFYRIEPFSLDRLYHFTQFFLGVYCDINEGLFIIEFMSELIKAGQNSSDEFQQLYLNHMMIGGIALDLDIITFPEEFLYFRNIKYDRGRLFFYANTRPFITENNEIELNNSNLDKIGFYERYSLEFDEKEGFHPAKFLQQLQSFLILALMYHAYQLVTIENDSGNTWIDCIIKDLNYGIKECNEYFYLIKEFNEKELKEIHQSMYAALADAGYVNMAVNAWNLFIENTYGIEKAKKYIQIAMDNGDKESIEFYNSKDGLCIVGNAIESYNFLFNLLKFCKMGNIPQSLYYFLLFLESLIDRWKYYLEFKISDYYYVMLALMARNKGNYNDYIYYLKSSGLFLNEKECFYPSFKKMLLLQMAGCLLKCFHLILDEVL